MTAFISRTYIFDNGFYYFIQGFWLDIRLLIANADPAAVAVCFVLTLALLLAVERKRMGLKAALFSVFAAAYGTFLLAVTVLGRAPGSVSDWGKLLLTYERAFSGDAAAMLDIFYNIVLFIPVGMIISRYKNLKCDFIVLTAIPVTVELIQLITARGVFELTDVINNFAGGAAGLAAARAAARFINYIKSRKGGRVERTK